MQYDQLTEITGLDFDGRVRIRGWTLQDWTMTMLLFIVFLFIVSTLCLLTNRPV